MAEAGMFATTDLGPLLAERGVVLSREQVYRLVAGTPERLSLRTLVEPVLDAKPASRRAAAGRTGAAAATAPAVSRPKRARIVAEAPEQT